MKSTPINQPLHVFGIVYGPSIYFHAQVVGLFNPFRMSFEYVEVIVGSGASPFFQFFGRGRLPDNIPEFLWGKTDKFWWRVARKLMYSGVVLQSHVFHHLHDTFYGTCFLFVSCGFQFQNNAFSVVQPSALPQGGSCSPLSSMTAVHCCAVDFCIFTLESAIVVLQVGCRR